MTFWNFIGIIFKFFDLNHSRIYCDICGFRRAVYHKSNDYKGNVLGRYSDVFICKTCLKQENKSNSFIKKL